MANEVYGRFLFQNYEITHYLSAEKPTSAKEQSGQGRALQSVHLGIIDL